MEVSLPSSRPASESQRALASPLAELEAAIESMRSMDALEELAAVRGALGEFRDQLFSAAEFARTEKHFEALTTIRLTKHQLSLTFSGFERLDPIGETQPQMHRRLAAFSAWQMNVYRIIRAIHLVISNNLEKAVSA